MTAQSHDADRRPPNSDSVAPEAAPHPDTSAARLRQAPARQAPTRQAPARQAPKSSRLARRAAIRAQRQAERQAERRQKSTPANQANQSGQSGQSIVQLHPKGRAKSASSSPVAVRSFRPKPSLWVSLLVWLQRSSNVVTLALTAVALITYGWTVYSQERWGRSFEELESLKKQERQLVSTNEVLKNQMAEQAENPRAGLLLPDPSNAIFLTPAPQRPPVKPKPPVPVVESDPIRPLGY